MNILFYVEPWIEREWPSWKDHWLPQLFSVVKSLGSANNNARFFFVVGDAQVSLVSNLGEGLDVSPSR